LRNGIRPNSPRDSAAQQHFLDLCELVGHPKPAALDQFGDTFTFERGASTLGGGDGWADVWKKGFFGWEYKGRDKDLDAAYPPLLVVCDLHTIIVRTNFTNTPTETHTIPLAEIGEPRSLEILRALFNTPEKLKPGTTSQVVTEHAARQIAQIAERLREQGTPAEEVAVFLDRVVFCLFAEDVGLLPNQLFQATKLDWAAVDASIFGTLFERGLDPAKRSQRRFLRRLTTVKGLDPACGSGNFLYVTLQKMKDLEKQNEARFLWLMAG